MATAQQPTHRTIARWLLSTAAAALLIAGGWHFAERQNHSRATADSTPSQQTVAPQTSATRSHLPTVAGTTQVLLSSEVPTTRPLGPPGQVSPAIAAWPAMTEIGNWEASSEEVSLCQYGCCSSESDFTGVDCRDCPTGCRGELRWDASRTIPWQAFGQGEYVGPSRAAHLPKYRLRVDDTIQFIFRRNRVQSATAYRLNVGDQLMISSMTDEKLNRTVRVQGDGKITAVLLGQVQAADRTIEDLTADLEARYQEFYRVPAINVTPVELDTRLQDLLAAVDRRFGEGGQALTVTVSPDGTVQLPAIETVQAQGLTLDEIQREIDQRYDAIVDGLDVSPILAQRAPRHIFVMGEVRQPNRYTMEGPTTVMQAIALAGGWNNGGNIRHVVIFRRTEDWRLMATRLDLAGALYGQRPCPADEVWVRDSDIVLVPKSGVLMATDFIDLVFTRGIYGVMPFSGVSINMSKASTL